MQLALALRLRDEATFSNFYGDQNQQLIAQLQAWAADQGEPFIYLWGSLGAGCTHLLQACCHAADAQGFRVAYLSLAQFRELSPQILENLETYAMVCLDDVDSIAGCSLWEEALFHLYNRARDTATRLLIAAAVPPPQLPFELLDLKSRLAWGLIFQVTALSDEEKVTALQQRARALGLELTREVSQFLLRHCPRDSGRLFAVLDQLDHASLTAQRKLTVPFVKQVLGI